MEDTSNALFQDHKFLKSELENMNPQKLLNYVLQNLETANNVCILYEIFKILRGKNTKLVLYVYDSFLFDVDKNEKELLEQIAIVIK
jgi:site-specific recombinase